MLPCPAADPGQTYNTSAMLDSLLATQPALVMCIGDFSYADDWMSMDQHVDAWHDGKYSCESGHRAAAQP